MDHSPKFLKVVTDARSNIHETNVEKVKKRLDAGEQFTLVDTREDSEWERGHIPGAIHIGRGVIERDIERLMPDTSAPLVLYCGGGFRSALAAESLQRMGYTNVLSMDGGWTGWNAAGYPTTSASK
jgi:rhodanese-related sulfurtransferase